MKEFIKKILSRYQTYNPAYDNIDHLIENEDELNILINEIIKLHNWCSRCLTDLEIHSEKCNVCYSKID
jgi:hypothetical protein